MPEKPVKIKTLVIGVTGQLATGKTTVASMFAQRGAAVINADLIAHRSIRKKGKCYSGILRIFGTEILNKGEIDRKRLAELVFRKAALLKKLEAVIHPFVAAETLRQIRQFKKNGRRLIILDVPLLFESGMDQMTDLVIAVKTTSAVQMKRCLAGRKLSFQEARARIKMQMSMSEKARRADIIIDNNGGLNHTQKQIQKICDILQRRYRINI